ncbi:MAG: hypothetical protein HC880_06215 [Bacteroidia bacterium]|nr:hypothetical protein [Bacteroidia bacterium]
MSAQFRFPLTKKLAVSILETNLNIRDTSIVIQYKLEGPGRRYYTTRLYYSNNGGNSFKGPLRSLEGDIGDSIRVGDPKQVAWTFREDNPYFDGKNIMFRLEAIEIPKIANGGPENALRSLLIPGLGDTKVRNGYNYGWITALTYGCLGTGAIFHIQARQDYNDYEARIPNTEEEHQNLFNRAERNQNLAEGFFIAGATIWVADVIGVYIRGLKNRRRITAEREKAEGEDNTETGFHWMPSIAPYHNTYTAGSGISLIWRY